MKKEYEAIVIGGSAGGAEALCPILLNLSPNLKAPILVVLHVGSNGCPYTIELLNKTCPLKVKEADDKESITPATIYLAPANHHMLVEEDRSISFSRDEKVCYSRPSIDLLFETAAEVYQEKLIGLLLSGANNDGSQGLKKINQNGGTTIVQNPHTAKFSYMPQAAIECSKPNYILNVENIAPTLMSLLSQPNHA